MASDIVMQLAQVLWDFHHVHHTLEKSDCILVLGSHDLRVAARGAELYLQGWAPLLVFSGGLGNLTLGVWTETEAERFARIALDMGVPEEAILIENRSTNTGENILFTQGLLKEKGIDPNSFIVVQVIHIMVGDLQRILIYPARGFQIHQDIPDAVLEAYRMLIALGYDKHTVKD